MDSEGKINSFDIKGSLGFKIMNPAVKCISIKTKTDSKDVQLRVPPQFDKKKWAEQSIIIPKDLSQSFKPKAEISVLKYKYSETGKDRSPFLIQFWHSPGKISVELEYNTSQTWIQSLDN